MNPEINNKILVILLLLGAVRCSRPENTTVTSLSAETDTPTMEISPTLSPSANPTLTLTPNPPDFSTPFPTVAVDSEVEFELLGQIGGTYSTIAIEGGYAYVGVGPRVKVYDIREPAAVTEVSQSDVLGGLVTDIVVMSDVAYVLVERGMLFSFNVSQPANPVLIDDLIVTQEISDSGENQFLQVMDNYIYIAWGDIYNLSGDIGSITIVEISPLSHMDFVKTIDVSFAPQAFQISGDFAYLSAGRNGLQIYDLSILEHPVHVSSFELDTFAGDLTISDNYLYLLEYSEVMIIDIENPSLPEIVGSIPLTNRTAPTIDIDGKYIYYVGQSCDVCGCGMSLNVIDISNPRVPKSVATHTGLLSGAADLAVIGGYVYYLARGDCSDGGGFQVINFSDLNNPVDTFVQYDVQVSELEYSLGHVFTSSSSSLQAIDVRDPSSPRLVGVFEFPWLVESHDINDGFAYVTTWSYGFYIIDVRDPTNLLEVGHLDKYLELSEVVIRDGIAYISNYYSFEIVDVSNPNTPVPMTQIMLDDLNIYGIWAMAVDTNYAYFVNGDLMMLDVTDPSKPYVVSSLENEWYPSDLAISGNYVYLPSRENVLHVVDVADPNNPIKVGSINIPMDNNRITIQGKLAYIASGKFGIWIIDVSDPTAPEVIGHFDLVAISLDVYGSNIYVNAGNQGLFILKMSQKD